MEDEKLKNEDLDAQNEINPADLVFNESEMASDEDMPEPETHTYEDPNKKKLLRPTIKFYKLFYQCLGSMPGGLVLTNENNQKINLSKLIGFIDAKIDAHQDTMTVDEMNTILSFVLNCPYNQVKEFADLVQNNQIELWTLIQ